MSARLLILLGNPLRTFTEWRQRRNWAAMHLEWLRTMVYGDARWLALNPIASALTQRYKAALRDDWYALDHEDTPRLRTRLGLDPSRATGRSQAPSSTRLAIEAVLQAEYVALVPGECVPLQTSAPVTYPGLEAIYMAGMQRAADAPRTAACAQLQADAPGALLQRLQARLDETDQWLGRDISNASPLGAADRALMIQAAAEIRNGRAPLPLAPSDDTQESRKCLPNGIRYLLPPLVLSGYQLREALTFLAPDGIEEQMESELCIAERGAGVNLDGEKYQAGLCCWLAEYPDEGSIALDGTVDFSTPTARPQATHAPSVAQEQS